MPGVRTRPFPSPNDPIEHRVYWIRAWLFLTVCVCSFGLAFVGGVLACMHDRSYTLAWMVGLFTGIPLTVWLFGWEKLLRILILWKK
jgi:hypothetical protein